LTADSEDDKRRIFDGLKDECGFDKDAFRAFVADAMKATVISEITISNVATVLDVNRRSDLRGKFGNHNLTKRILTSIIEGAENPKAELQKLADILDRLSAQG
jgi:hypothetical protein